MNSEWIISDVDLLMTFVEIIKIRFKLAIRHGARDI